MKALEDLLAKRDIREPGSETLNHAPIGKAIPTDANQAEHQLVNIDAKNVFAAFPHLDLSEKVVRHGQYPVATNGAFADIWQGALKDRMVAIKVLRVALAPDEKTKKACLLNFASHLQ